MNGHEASMAGAGRHMGDPTPQQGQDAFAPPPAGMVSELFDFDALRLMVILNHRLILAILGVGLLLGAASLVIMPKVYTARSSVQIDQQERKVLGTEDSDPVAFGTEADRFLQTQVDILTSRAMAKRVSDTLGLAANDKFLELATGHASSDLTPDERLDRVIETLQRNLAVDLPRNSRIVAVTYRSRDAQLSAKIANTFVSEFIKGNIQRKFSASSYSLDFLSNQLGVAKSRLEQSERLLITYSRAAGLIDASSRAAPQGEPQQGPQSLVTANLVELNSRSAEAKAARLQAEERWLEASKTPLMELPEVLSNDAIQRLLQKRAELSSSLQELRVHLKADHPSVVQAATELAEIDSEAKVLAEAIRASIHNQYRTAARQDAALQGAVDGLKLATLSEQDRGVRYNILKREVDTNRQLYDSLLQRYKEVSAASGVTVNNIAQVDVAEAPRKPTSPRILVNMAIALALSIVTAAAAVLVRGHLVDTINDPREVEDRLGIPLLGVVPLADGAKPLDALAHAKSNISEAYHAIRTAIELSSSAGLPSSLLLTSNSPAEGKSTSSFALARDFALLGKKVLLIDADLRRPSLHVLLELGHGAEGLSSVLARKTAPRDAILDTGIENLGFMPSGPIPPDPANLFSGSRLKEMLAELEEHYDLIVLDAPPVLAIADALELTAVAKVTVFVMEAGVVRVKSAQQSLMRLHRAGGRVIGAVATKYNLKMAGNSNAYTYSYGN